MNKNIFVGIDVSKDTLDISLGEELFKILNCKKTICTFIKKQMISQPIKDFEKFFP